jgi:hypothetical protein
MTGAARSPDVRCVEIGWWAIPRLQSPPKVTSALAGWIALLGRAAAADVRSRSLRSDGFERRARATSQEEAGALPSERPSYGTADGARP